HVPFLLQHLAALYLPQAGYIINIVQALANQSICQAHILLLSYLSRTTASERDRSLCAAHTLNPSYNQSECTSKHFHCEGRDGRLRLRVPVQSSAYRRGRANACRPETRRLARAGIGVRIWWAPFFPTRVIMYSRLRILLCSLFFLCSTGGASLSDRTKPQQ